MPRPSDDGGVTASTTGRRWVRALGTAGPLGGPTGEATSDILVFSSRNDWPPEKKPPPATPTGQWGHATRHCARRWTGPATGASSPLPRRTSSLLQPPCARRRPGYVRLHPLFEVDESSANPGESDDARDAVCPHRPWPWPNHPDLEGVRPLVAPLHHVGGRPLPPNVAATVTSGTASGAALLRASEAPVIACRPFWGPVRLATRLGRAPADVVSCGRTLDNLRDPPARRVRRRSRSLSPSSCPATFPRKPPPMLSGGCTAPVMSGG